MKLKEFSLDDVKPGMRILMRIDCNVPIKDQVVVDGSTLRLEQTLGDIRELIAKGAVVILMGHLGRPHGVKKSSLSLRPVAKWYENQLEQKLVFIKEITKRKNIQKVHDLKPGSIVLLENLRFYPNETFNCVWFSKRLARYADVYVNNAFGVSHRRHASIKNVTRFIPSYAGSIIVNELKKLSLKREHPFILALGGIKLKTKMPILLQLGHEADRILLGGGIAVAFELVLQGVNFQLKGKAVSRSERRFARTVVKRLKDKIVLPDDYICSRDGKMEAVLRDHLTVDDVILDIGPKTIEIYAQILKSARSVVFNGAMGSLEVGAQKGTEAIAKALPVKQQMHSIVGGGDTVGFLQKKKLLKHFNFASTGGGAMLAFLAGQKLPGLEVLKK